MSYSGGNGSGSIATSSDTALSSPLDGDALVYDAGVQKWRNSSRPTGAINLSGLGIDPTAATSSRSAVQAILTNAPANSTIKIPDTAVLLIDGPLTITKALRLVGGGELRFVAGTYPGGRPALLSINADGCSIEGIRLTNPTNISVYSIMVNANRFRAINNNLINVRDGINVNSYGEYHDIIIANNFILDVFGNGGGSSDTTDIGESVGDGICIWGAAATITGNRISCKAGSDARIGIHSEALAGDEATAYANADTLSTITGNVVSGQFRRGIVYEGVYDAVITGNTVADATWWSYAIIFNGSCILSNNVARYTRTASDTQGSYWAPVRGGIMLQGSCTGSVISGNVIHVGPTATADAGIIIVNNLGTPTRLTITNNAVEVAAGGSLARGLYANLPSTDLRVSGNSFTGHTSSGIYMWQAASAEITGNSIRGGSNANHGIHIENGGTDHRISDNTIRTAAIGIEVVGANRCLMSQNVIDTATTGIQAYGSTNTTLLDNIYRNVSGSTTTYISGGTGNYIRAL